MAQRSTVGPVFLADPNSDALKPIREGVHRFGVEAIGGSEPKNVAVVLPGGSGETIAGAIGHGLFGIFYLTHLWVASELRRQGHGSAVLRALEEAIPAMGCDEVRLDTMNPESVPFYEHHGYETYVLLPEYIKGFGRYFMRKRIERGAAVCP